MKILSSVSSPTGTRSCHVISATSQTLTNVSTGKQCSATMHDSIINVPCRGFPSVPLIKQLYMTMLDATAAKVSAHRCFRYQCFDHEVIDCPFPLGACWRRIQHQRRLLKASRAGEPTRDTSSSAPSPGAQAPNCQLSSTKVGRSASSTSPTHAPSPTAEVPMSAGTVSRNTQLWSVVLQEQLPLNLNNFKHYLACHPDRQWSESLLQGIQEGVDIGYQGNRKTVWSGNWKLALDNGSVVSKYLSTEVALGRKAGPFNQPPFHTGH